MKKRQKEKKKRYRKRMTDNQLKAIQIKDTEQHRLSRNSADESQRLKSFLISTSHNAIFYCICCHQRHFKSNTILYSEDLISSINEKSPELLKKIIVNDNISANFHTEYPHEKWSDSYRNSSNKVISKHICLTCVRYMKNRKMPPMCVQNGLELHETFSKIKADGLWLSELENSLIARTIVFMMRQASGLRWRAPHARIFKSVFSWV